MINNKYILEKEIGKGRSKVYLAKHVEYDTKFALKILPATSRENEIASFKKEYNILKNLNHSSIIEAFEYGEIFKIDSPDYNYFDVHTGDKIIVEEYFDGSNLTNYISKLDEDELTFILIRILLALYYLHQNNYIYHDLKPENVLYSNGKVKLIDFGLAEHVKLFPSNKKSGSLNYLAPEILTSTQYSFNSDLYSLGVLIYKMIYGKTPYDIREGYKFAEDIFGKEIDFPETGNFKNILPVLKKLLSKNPDERYQTSLEVLKDLDYKLAPKDVREFTNSAIYICNDEIHQKIDDFFLDESTRMLFVQGCEGSGKSELLNYIHENYDHTVLVKGLDVNSGDFWVNLIEEIIYTEDIFKELGEGIVDSLYNLLHSGDGEPFAIYRLILLKISERVTLKLLFDDINLYEDFLKESLSFFIPILQVNNVKIIGTESNEEQNFSSNIENKLIVSLESFTENERLKFVDYSFADFYPKDKLNGLINKYSDSNPGSINNLVTNLLEFGGISYENYQPEIDETNDNIKLLNINRKELILKRIEDLTDLEKNILRNLSLFDVKLNSGIFIKICGLDEEKSLKTFTRLEEKNLIKIDKTNQIIKFLNETDKEVIKSGINNITELVERILFEIESQNLEIENLELARLYSYLDNSKALKIYLSEIEINEEKKNYLFSKQLYLKALDLNMSISEEAELRLKFAQLLDTLGNFKDSYYQTQLIENEYLGKSDEFILFFIRARALIRLSKPKLGLELLKLINRELKDKILKARVNLEIANVHFNLNSYRKAERILLSIILEQSCNNKTLGEAYNLLGLITIRRRRNFKLGIKYLKRSKKIFESNNLMQPLIGTEINLGIINSILNDKKTARYHWENALKINKSIGNLYQQGRLHSNYGTFHLRNFDLESAIKEYNEANKIAATLGDRLMQGITYVNLGEVYQLNCEYSKSLKSYNKAESIFKKVKNYEEFGAVLLGKAKLFYELNNPGEIKKVINFYFQHLENDIEIEKNSLYLNLINITYDLLIGKNDIDELRLKDLIDKFGMNDDLMSYSFAYNLYIRYLILQNEESKAVIELNDPVFMEISETNPLFKAQRLYLLGIISRVTKNIGLDHHLNYLKSSFQILEELSITELTWKVLLALSETFYERGNFTQLEKYSKYAKMLLKKIVSSIKEDDIRQTYVDSLPVKSAIEKINFFTEKTNYV